MRTFPLFRHPTSLPYSYSTLVIISTVCRCVHANAYGTQAYGTLPFLPYPKVCRRLKGRGSALETRLSVGPSSSCPIRVFYIRAPAELSRFRPIYSRPQSLLLYLYYYPSPRQPTPPSLPTVMSR